MTRFALLLSLLLWAVSSSAQQVDFVTTIHPLLAKRCLGCHSGENPQGGLSLTSRALLLKGGPTGPAAVPGRSTESLMMKRISGASGPLMPLGGPRLSDAESKALAEWIDEGAPWTDTAPKPTESWNAPLSLLRPAVPESKYQNPIDRFLEVYGRERHITFPEPVNDGLFARRAYLDLWGVVPSAAQVLQFTNDKSADKRTRLIDELLQNSALYSGNWISFWNDLLRNDTGVNYAGTRKSITPWLQSALMQNLPYDRMVAELIHPVKPGDPDGFLLGVNWRGAVNASQTPYMQAAQNTAQVFLGVNLKCASCHDSFINRYKLKQSYGMAALFSEEKQLELVRCDVKTGKSTGPEFLFPQLGSVPQEGSPGERRAAAAKLFTSPENGRLARTMVNRVWGRLFAYGLVEPVDEMDNRPWNANLLDWLAADFADHGYDLKRLLRQVMISRAYQLPSVPGQDIPGQGEYTFRGPRPRRLTAEQFMDMASALTGEWPVLQTDRGASFVREWQVKSTPLSRALGRPIRDQVFTTRNPDATTLQALELVNGETLGALLRRGSLRLLGKLPVPPAPLFDSKTLSKGSKEIDLDLTGVNKLWLLVSDVNSYDPARTFAGWADIELTGPQGTKKKLGELPSLVPFEQRPLTAVKKAFSSALVPGIPSTLVFDISGLGFTRMQGSVAVDDVSVRSDVSPAVRFFVFGAEPDRHQLIAVTGEPPLPAAAPISDPDALVTALFNQALLRPPSGEEMRIARTTLMAGGKISAAGLEDLLWSLLMHPELQYIY